MYNIILYFISMNLLYKRMQKKTRKGKREKGELLTPKNMIKYSSDILKYKSYSNSSLWYN